MRLSRKERRLRDEVVDDLVTELIKFVFSWRRGIIVTLAGIVVVLLAVVVFVAVIVSYYLGR